MKEVICNIVQDLLPNYSEELTSPETSAVIEEHLETCNECRRLYEDYRKTVEVAKPEEVKANKKDFAQDMVSVAVVYVLAMLLCDRPDGRMGERRFDFSGDLKRPACSGAVSVPCL